MMRTVGNGRLVAGLCVGLLVSGCATYYRVSDPQTKNEYYTQKIDTLRSGAVKLKDARTGSVVTLQVSEVKEISSDEYKAALAAPAKPAAPAAATVPATAPTEAPATAPAEQPK